MEDDRDPEPGFGELVDDGELVTAWIRAIQYIRPDGKERWTCDWSEEANYSTVIGLAEMAKGRVLEEMRENEDAEG